MAKNAHYTGVTPEVYNQLKDKLQSMGLHLQGDSGSIKEKGVSANYNYDPAAQALHINDLSVGFPASMMISADKLVARMDEMIVQYGGRPQQA
ncbi:hypothetical protein [Botryobacter ruber]|uniref:hypothetical protein n=1 Tax=Botryobacter ruber TaxID=2171629 RepID=UPI000E0C826A|nr:hypothetical protein [Botryobacter ruber]